MKNIAHVRTTIFLVGIALICMVSCSTQKHSSAKYTRPTFKQIIADLDSICNEGYNLFVAERINWVSTDSALSRYNVEDFGGNIIWQPTDSTWEAVFYDTKQENCIFEMHYNTHNQETNFSYKPRPITDSEKAQVKLKYTMLENTIKLYGDSLRYNGNYGQANMDFVRIDRNTVRLYILQGIEIPDIIPFGNDYSIDFDNEGNIKAFRRYHHSFLAIPTKDEKGDNVSTVYHSHLKDNPYITPTDICSFLLYRGEMKQTMVLSTALDGVIIYNAESNSAAFLTKEAMERINNDNKE